MESLYILRDYWNSIFLATWCYKKALAFFLYVFFSLNPSAQRIEQKHRCIEHHREVIEKDNRQPATPCLWFYRQRPWKFSMQDTSKYLQRFESYTYSIKKTVQGIIYVCSEPTALVKQNIFWTRLKSLCPTSWTKNKK